MCVCDVQDLQLALEKARSALQEREEQLREGEQERQREDEERERTIGELRTSLLTKEQLIEVRDVRTVRSEQLLSCFVTDIDRVRLGSYHRSVPCRLSTCCTYRNQLSFLRQTLDAPKRKGVVVADVFWKNLESL